MDLKALEAAIVDVTTDSFMSVVKVPEVKKYNGIVLHHSYAPERPIWGRDYGVIFNRFHSQANGWANGLGYQFVLTWNPSNPKETRIQASYRWVNQLVGAHTLNRKKQVTDGLAPNETMVGLCIVGNFDINPLPPETYLEAKKFVDVLLATLNIPRTNIYGHYQFDYKTCPGKRMDVAFFRR